jgi:hypothetical protein
MIDHTGIGVSDMARSAIYAALKALGLSRVAPDATRKWERWHRVTDISIRSSGSIGFTPTVSTAHRICCDEPFRSGCVL